MAEKFKAQKFTTGAGIAQYPYITKPDGKFPTENPVDVYKCNLILEDDEKTRTLINRLEEVRDAKLEETKERLNEKMGEANPADKKKLQKKLKELNVAEVCEEHYDDAGEETGSVILKFKLNKEVKNRKTGETFHQQPNVFDCSKPPKPLKGVDIWSGSELKIAGEIVPYFMESTNTVGVSLRLKGVQVVKLVGPGVADAAAYGFDGDDGGFHQEDDGASDFDGEAADEGEDDDF